MRHVETIENGCVLACLESFFFDNKLNITQLMLIDLLPRDVCTYDGIIWELERAVNCLKLDYQFIGTGNSASLGITIEINNLPINEAILIMLKGNTAGQNRHCMRCSKNTQIPQELFVMDPNSQDKNRGSCEDLWDLNRLNLISPLGWDFYKIAIPISWNRSMGSVRGFGVEIIEFYNGYKLKSGKENFY